MQSEAKIVSVVVTFSFILVVSSDAATVKLGNEIATRSGQDRLVSPLCVENDIKPKILRCGNIIIIDNMWFPIYKFAMKCHIWLSISMI